MRIQRSLIAPALFIAVLIGWRMPLLFRHEVNAFHAPTTATSGDGGSGGEKQASDVEEADFEMMDDKDEDKK